MGTGKHTNYGLLDGINSDPTLDACTLLNSYVDDDENVSQFFQTRIQSSYHDVTSFKDLFNRSSNPLILSLNIQSLNSKYESLKSLVSDLLNALVPLDLIIIQETWEVKYPSLFTLPGFQQIITRTRDGKRGGGVGICIRNGLNFVVRGDLEDYKLNTFENIVLEILYPNKSMILSNIYRSPTPPPNLTVSDHTELFLNTLDSHLARLSNLTKTYMFLLILILIFYAYMTILSALTISTH